MSGMAEEQDPPGLTYNGIQFGDFCPECRDVLLALRLRKIPRGEICQSCAWRLIAAAANPAPAAVEDPGNAEASVQPVIDARLARIMGRELARSKPKILPAPPGGSEQFGIALPGEEVIVFDLRKKYHCALLQKAQAMVDLLREMQWNEALGRFVPICPECGGLKPDGDVPPDPPDIGEHLWGHGKGCRMGKILAALDAARAVDGN